MKLSRIARWAVPLGALGYLAVHSLPVHNSSNHDETASVTAEEATHEASAKIQATVGFAKFLEKAPARQLQPMLTGFSGELPPSRESFLPYTKRADSSELIAKMLGQDDSFSASQEARARLLDNPTRSAQDILLVLGDLPESFPTERAELISLLGEMANHLDNQESVESALIAEAKRPTPFPGATKTVPQATALRTYFRIVHDPEKRSEAYKAALDAQDDADVRAVLQQFQPAKPPGPV